jgi:ketosteroid isomerase-like protein
VTTPREVLDRLLSGIGAGRWAELADLYAEDGVAQQPFQLPEPGRIEGREEIRRHFTAAASGPLRLHPHHVVVHETVDPEVVIAEFDYDVRNAATGREVTVANVQVLRVRDGLIVGTRDYHDHARMAAVGGSRPVEGRRD